MAAISLTESSVAALKSVLRGEFPEVKSSHLTEALAHALGFRTHASLLAAVASTDTHQQLVLLSTQKLLERLERLGYPHRSEFDFELMPLKDIPGAVSTGPVSPTTAIAHRLSVDTRVS